MQFYGMMKILTDFFFYYHFGGKEDPLNAPADWQIT